MRAGLEEGFEFPAPKISEEGLVEILRSVREVSTPAFKLASISPNLNSGMKKKNGAGR